VLCLAAAACDSTGPGGNGSKVAIRFGTGSASAARADLSVANDLTLTGTNGTLVIQDVRFIVEDMKLKSSDTNSACSDDNQHEDDDNLMVASDRGSNGNDDNDREEDDDCEVHGGPFIVTLNLNGGSTTVSTANVPAGTYDAFRFRIDDLTGEHDDEADDSTNAANVLDQMRTVYPNFPARASMVVKGTQNGQPFTVYFRSKLKIRDAISPPLVVPTDNVLSVNIDPTLWFKNGGQVLNLLALNGKLVDFGEGFRGAMRGSHRGDDD